MYSYKSSISKGFPKCQYLFSSNFFHEVTKARRTKAVHRLGFVSMSALEQIV